MIPVQHARRFRLHGPRGSLSAIVVCLGSMLAASGLPAQEAMEPFDCPSTAFLIQGRDAFGVDLLSGEVETLATNFHIANINGFGYNVLDDFIYGWDQEEIVRVDSNWQVEGLGAPPGTSRSNIGDVDENGHFWFITGGSWFQVDLDPDSDDFFEILNQGPVTGGGIEEFAFGRDWAYVPGAGNYLFRVMRDDSTDPGTSVLFRFDRGTGGWENLGNLGELGANEFGAVYTDADGFLYASDNETGGIYRIDVQAASAELFSLGPASGTNDGGRCHNAALATPSGAAPTSIPTNTPWMLALLAALLALAGGHLARTRGA